MKLRCNRVVPVQPGPGLGVSERKDWGLLLEAGIRAGRPTYSRGSSFSPEQLAATST